MLFLISSYNNSLGMHLTSSALEEEIVLLLLSPQDHGSKLWACECTRCRQLIRKGRERHPSAMVFVSLHESHHFGNKMQRRYLSIRCCLKELFLPRAGAARIRAHLMRAFADQVRVQVFAALKPEQSVIVGSLVPCKEKTDSPQIELGIPFHSKQ